jgi:two-component system sensor histidine kinase/response regulator
MERSVHSDSKNNMILLSSAMEDLLRRDEDYVFVKNADFVYLSASDAFARMAGFGSAAEVSGKTDYDLFPQAIADKYRADDKMVLETGKSFEGIVERLPEKDGQERWTKTWKRPVRDGEGRVVGLYAMGRDVTSVVDLEAEVRTARKYLDIISNLPGGVGVAHELGGEFYLDYINDGWSHAHHLSEEQGQRMTGGSVLELICEEDRHLLAEEYQRVKNDRNLQGSATYRIHGGDGALHWVNAQFRFAYEESGVNYYYVSYTDMDEQKRAEEKLFDSQAALHEAMSNSDIQFFTYFPGRKRGEIYAVSNRLAGLPTVWSDFPDDFLTYTKASADDAAAYKAMLHEIDEGADEAKCTVQLAYKGVYSWEKIQLRAVRDTAGHTTHGLGYSLNVTSQVAAKDRLQKERVRIKALEGGIFEAFSFNLSKNSEPEIQTADAKFFTEPLRDEVVKQALLISPPISGAHAKTREVMLRAACRIPDARDRELFISACGGSGLQKAVKAGRYNAEIKYRRLIGDEIRWVATRAEVLHDPETGDIIAFFYTKNINDEVINEKVMARILGLNYESVGFCDLQTRKYFVRTAGDSAAGASFRSLPYDQVLEAEAAQTGDQENARDFRDKLRLEKILTELEKSPVYTVYSVGNERREDLPGCPRKQMKKDVFYLDEHKDVVVFLLTDVTDIFEHERENRERMSDALAAARQASEAKSSFLSRMSHEIRTPLNAIIGMDAIAAQSLGNSEKEADCISKIGISARYLLSLINDILDMSRIESGKMLLKNEKFLFSEFIANINTMIYNQTKSKGLDYECVVSSEIAAAYVGDAMKLQQVLINILGNAVKFTEKGKVSLDIRPISGSSSGRSVLRFTVNDTGIGISDEFIDRIYEPFEQSDATSTTVFGGTGLGLAITKNLVGLMGGVIKVRSILGIGSEFTVEVPLEIDESVPVPPRLDLHFEKMSALIVDDDIVVCEQTDNILKDIGMVGEWVTTGREAVDRVMTSSAAEKFYDYILIDWKMPDMDGIETTRQIRKIVGPDVTIIIITAYDWESIEAEAKAAGANLLVSKPLLKTTLVSAFQKARGEQTDSGLPSGFEFDFTGKRVLLAEDNQLNAEIAKTLLESKHFEVDTAVNGLQAMEMYTQKQTGYYSAILMDIRMPLMDGLQACRNIRHWNKEDAKTIPIVAMTANAFDEDVEKSKAAGMNAHLAKPIDPDLMYGTLYRLISEKEGF